MELLASPSALLHPPGVGGGEEEEEEGEGEKEDFNKLGSKKYGKMCKYRMRSLSSIAHSSTHAVIPPISKSACLMCDSLPLDKWAMASL